MRIPWISLVVTAIIFYVAAQRLDWQGILVAFQTMDPRYAGLAFGSWVGVVVFKSLKWKTVVSALKGRISILGSIRISFIGMFVGILTPGRMGDFVRAAYMKDSIGLGKGFMAVFLDRVMDVLTLLVFSGLGILVLANTSGFTLVTPIQFGVILGVFLVGVLLSFNRGVARWMWKVIKPLLPSRMSGIISTHGGEFYASIPLLKKNKWRVVGSFLLGIGAWLLIVTMGYFLMRAVHIVQPWETALLAIPIMSLVELIPTGIAGLGTREFAAVVVLGAYGISPESAVAFSLLYFAFGYIPSFIMGAIALNSSPSPVEGGWKSLFSHASVKQSHSGAQDKGK